MKVAIPFWSGGGGGGVGEEEEGVGCQRKLKPWGEAPPPLKMIDCQGQLIMHSVTPPPRVSGSAPGMYI